MKEINEDQWYVCTWILAREKSDTAQQADLPGTRRRAVSPKLFGDEELFAGAGYDSALSSHAIWRLTAPEEDCLIFLERFLRASITSRQFDASFLFTSTSRSRPLSLQPQQLESLRKPSSHSPALFASNTI